MENSKDQQEENSLQNLEGEEAIAKIKKIAESAQTCFFCTSIKTGLPFSTRPMQLQEVDEEGNLWFLSSNTSIKDAEITADPFVQIMFQESTHSGFLSIYGIAETSKDRSKIDEYWSPVLKVWFQDGKDDPRISVIKVVPSKAYYWDNKNGSIVSFIKMAASIVIGKTMDDGVEGNIDV